MSCMSHGSTVLQGFPWQRNVGIGCPCTACLCDVHRVHAAGALDACSAGMLAHWRSERWRSCRCCFRLAIWYCAHAELWAKSLCSPAVATGPTNRPALKRVVLAQLCSVLQCLPWPAGVVGGIVAAAVLAVVAFFVIRRHRRSRNRTAAERSAKVRRAPKKPAARGGHPANGTNAAPFLDSPRKSESSTGGSGTSGSPIMKESPLPGEPSQGDCSMGAASPCISGSSLHVRACSWAASLCSGLSMLVTCSFRSLRPAFCSACA